MNTDNRPAQIRVCHDLQLDSLSVGFDLRLHSYTVFVDEPEDDGPVSVSYDDGDDENRTIETAVGALVDVVKVLRDAGYTVTVNEKRASE